MRTATAGTWLSISEGSELACVMHSSDEAYLTVGESGVEHELSFDYATFKTLVEQANTVLAEMEAKAAEERTRQQPRRP